MWKSDWQRENKHVTYAKTDKAMNRWKKEPEFFFLTEASNAPP